MARTILLVDDSPTIRNIIKVYLMGRGFDFVEAEDGERALQVMQLVPVTLVIADINMPGMDGLTFVRKLRTLPAAKQRDLPVILMTGDRSEAIRVQAQLADADAFVHKPVTCAALTEAVEKLVTPGASP